MPDPALITAATKAVYDAFGTAPIFACLTGSAAADADTADSDIDLLVVLPNNLSIDQAVQQREAFTRNYIRLHATFGRTPDRQWPAEVCYATDLDAAIHGGAFDLKSRPLLRLCSLDHPYRYWVSMTATALPLTGHAAHARYAAHCAVAMLNHSGFNALWTAAPRSSACCEPEWGQWQIDPGRIDKTALSRAAQRSPDLYLAWREQLHRPRQPPRLDRWIEYWRDIADA